MVVQKDPAATACVDGSAFQSRVNGSDCVRKIRIYRQLHIHCSADQTNCRVIRRLQIRHTLRLGLSPKICLPHRIIRTVKTPKPVAHIWWIRVRRTRLQRLHHIAHGRIDGGGTGPEIIRRSRFFKNQRCPTSARIRWRPTCPWTITTRHAGLQIAPVWKTVFVIADDWPPLVIPL